MGITTITAEQRIALLNDYLIKYIAQYLTERFTKDPPENDRFHIGMPIDIEVTLKADPLNSFKDEVTATFKMACRMK